MNTATRISSAVLVIAATILSSCREVDQPEEAKVPVTSIELNASSTNLAVGGEPFLLSAVVKPDNADDKSITWKSTNNNVAMVNESGKVVPVEVGECDIIATSVSTPSVSAKCNIKVTRNEVKVTGISLDKSEIEVYIGTPEKLTATIAPEEATNKNVTWTSSDETVATVDNSGNVTGVAPGSTNILVTSADGGKSAICKVNVFDTKVTSIKIVNKPENTVVHPGDTFTPEVEFLPENASNKKYHLYCYEKNSKNYDATIRDNTITFGSVNCTLMVGVYADQNGDLYDEFEVTIEVELKSIALSPSELNVGLGTSAILELVAEPKNALISSVVWESDNEKVATVKDGTVTGVAAGTCNINVIVNDSYRASAKVTVLEANEVSINDEAPVSYKCGELSSLFEGKTVEKVVWTKTSIMNDLDATALRNYCSFSIKYVDMSKLRFCASGEGYKVGNDTFYVKNDAVPAYFMYFCRVETVILPDSIKEIGFTAFSNSHVKNINLPEGLRVIAYGAFSNSWLEGELVLPESLEVVTSDSFGETKITKVRIGKNVRDLRGNYWGQPFSDCNYLRDIVVDSQNKYYKVVDNVLVSADGQTLIAYPSARFVGKVAFPSGITNIGGRALHYDEINGPLEDVVIPEGVESLDHYALNYFGCKSLTLPSTLKKMSGVAVYLGKFESVTILAETPPAFSSYPNDAPFYYCERVKNIYVPAGSVEAYKKATGWSNKAGLIQAIPSE